MANTPVPIDSPTHSNAPIAISSHRAASLTLLDVFDRIALIDVASRGNHERIVGHLHALGLCRVPGFIDFAPEVRLKGPHGWASLAASTVFMTHYSVLKQALEFRWNSVLLWDASADFAIQFARHQSEVLHALSRARWDLLFLGYKDAGLASKPGQTNGGPRSESHVLSRLSGSIRGVSAYAVNRSVVGHLVKTMEQVLENPTRLVSPFSPTASSFEPDAISIVLSKLLRSRPDLMAFAPGVAAGTVRDNVIQLARTKSAGL